MDVVTDVLAVSAASTRIVEITSFTEIFLRLPASFETEVHDVKISLIA